MKFPIQRFTVSGNSMLPALKSGQQVLTFNWVKPKVGDIVIVKRGKEGVREIIKRISKINKHSIFVLGDNKKESTDSRTFGPISFAEIVGKVVLVVR